MDARTAVQALRTSDWRLLLNSLDTDQRMDVIDTTQPDRQLTMATIGCTHILITTGEEDEADAMMFHGHACESDALECFSNKVQQTHLIRAMALAAGMPAADLRINGQLMPIPAEMLGQVATLGDRIKERLGMVVPDDIRELLGR